MIEAIGWITIWAAGLLLPMVACVALPWSTDGLSSITIGILLARIYLITYVLGTVLYLWVT